MRLQAELVKDESQLVEILFVARIAADAAAVSRQQHNAHPQARLITSDASETGTVAKKVTGRALVVRLRLHQLPLRW